MFLLPSSSARTFLVVLSLLIAINKCSATTTTAANFNNSLVFLTYTPDGQQLSVNLISDQPNGQFVLEVEEQAGGPHSQRMPFVYNISGRQNAPKERASAASSLSGELPHTKRLYLYGTTVPVPLDGTLEYSLRNQSNGANGTLVEAVVELTANTNRTTTTTTNLTVCVFGDYRADMMYTRAISLGAYADANQCHLLLFIGKISWEQRDCPGCSNHSSSTISSSFTGTNANMSMPESGNPLDIGLSFSPFSMLHDNANTSAQVEVFSRVPTIFGAIGHNQNETSFFDCTEVDGVAFIQTTVEVSTVAKLRPMEEIDDLGDETSSEQFQYVEQYFRETMLNELECKLQELHRRAHRPWIVVYLTHPSLINERRTDVLSLKDNDRFFDILNRYHIDLLLSCGVEGMASILAERRENKPADELPPYLSSTMATCLNENDCQYLVLNVNSEQLDWHYMDGAGKRQRESQFQKRSQSVDKCIPDAIPSITGAVNNNGTSSSR